MPVKLNDLTLHFMSDKCLSIRFLCWFLFGFIFLFFYCCCIHFVYTYVCMYCIVFLMFLYFCSCWVNERMIANNKLGCYNFLYMFCEMHVYVRVYNYKFTHHSQSIIATCNHSHAFAF